MLFFSWPRFNSDSFTQNCRLNSDSTVGPSITYKLFQPQFISVMFQIQLNSDCLLQSIDSVHLNSIFVDWIGIRWVNQNRAVRDCTSKYCIKVSYNTSITKRSSTVALSLFKYHLIYVTLLKLLKYYFFHWKEKPNINFSESGTASVPID